MHFSTRWIIVLVLAVLAAGWFIFARSGGIDAPTLTIEPKDFAEQVSVSGTVTAAQSSDLGFASSGRIVGTYARVGQHVVAGTVLAETDNGDLAATVAQKTAALDSLLAGTRPEKIAVAQTAVANAQSALVNAVQSAYTTSDDAVHNKADTLFTNPRTSPKLSFAVANANLKSSVETSRQNVESVFAPWSSLSAQLTSTMSYDALMAAAAKSQGYLSQVSQLLADTNAALNQGVADQTTSSATLASYATTLATARANVNIAATALTSAISGLADAQKTLTLDQAGPTAADVAAAQAEVQNAKAQLAKTRVVAPFTGVVTRMDAKTGEIVSPNTSEISMQGDGVFQIETYIPEVNIARVASGNAATTTLDAYGSSVPFPSVVVSVDPAETVKDGVPTYKTTLSFLKADPRIRSGMTTNVMIETGVLHNAIVIPTGALGQDAQGPYVSLVVDKKPVRRAVQTGASPAIGQMVILSGLSQGDVILLSPVK